MSQHRIELGLYGGAVLGLTVDEEALGPLTAALSGGGWHEVTSEGDTYSLNTSQVQYVRVVARDPGARVGFGDD